MEEGPIDRRAPWTDQGHEEDWCLLEKLVRSFKTAVAHFSSTSVDEDQQRNDAPVASRRNETAFRTSTERNEQPKRRNETNSANGATKRTAQTAQQNSANGATKRHKQNATNTIATIVTNATNNDDNR